MSRPSLERFPRANMGHPHARGLVFAAPMSEGGGLTCYDATPYRNDGTITNMVPTDDWVVDAMGWTLDMDGGDDYVDVGTSPLFDTADAFLTVSFWVKPMSGTSTYDPLVSCYASSGTFRGWVMTRRNSTGNLWVFRNSGSAFWDTGYTLTSEWQHITFVKRAGNSAELYVDGVFFASNSFVLLGYSSGELRIGDWNTFSHHGAARIRDVRIHNVDMLAGEIMSVYRDPGALYRLPRRRSYKAVAAPPATFESWMSQNGARAVQPIVAGGVA